MLSLLRIADFAIIAGSELPLQSGLTALTGETGAGKSILMDALAMVLGGRGSEKSIRAGAAQTEIEAQFDGPFDPEVLAALREAGLPDDGEALILRRVLSRGGRSRCHINGRLVTQAQLRMIAAPLCDISSQHAQHRLLEPAWQLDAVDRFAGLFAGATPLRPQYDQTWTAWRTAVAEVKSLQAAHTARADRLDWLRFVQEELASLALRPGELAEVQAHLTRLKAADQIIKSLAEAQHRCEDEGGLRDQAVRLSRGLTRMGQLDPKLAALTERADEIAALSDELARDVAAAARHVERDDRELARLSERLDSILRAIKKHGGTEESLLQRQAQVAAELDEDQSELALAQAQARAAELAREVDGLAGQLTHARALQVAAMGAAITATIQRLGMPAATVRLELKSKPGEPGASGRDTVELLLRANTGEGEGRLADVASGGELSRVLLAVRRAGLQDSVTTDAEAQPLPVAVYDEVDAGLSGSTGLTLGRFLREVAEGQQVLVISHLPQVAAAADTHVRVHKLETDGRTHSHLEVLDTAGRETELARMLGSAGQSAETAVEHARRLVERQRGPVTSPLPGGRSADKRSAVQRT